MSNIDKVLITIMFFIGYVGLVVYFSQDLDCPQGDDACVAAAMAAAKADEGYFP